MFLPKAALLAVLMVGLGADQALAQTADKTAAAMSPVRQKVYAEIEQAFGFVPGFVKTMPDNSLESEWATLKAVQMAPGAIPNKYRELIGLAVAAARGCEYCTYFHTQFAKLNGATDAELEDAVHFAKSNMGWSTYLHGMQYDYAQFKKDVDRICDYAKSKQNTSAK
jgi:AhpD family alkylhydroperoxidase